MWESSASPTFTSPPWCLTTQHFSQRLLRNVLWFFLFNFVDTFLVRSFQSTYRNKSIFSEYRTAQQFRNCIGVCAVYQSINKSVNASGVAPLYSLRSRQIHTHTGFARAAESKVLARIQPNRALSNKRARMQQLHRTHMDTLKKIHMHTHTH